MNAAERKALRELHDAYGKHDIRPVTTIKADKQIPGYRIHGVYGQCSCGKAFSYTSHDGTWAPLQKDEVKIHMDVFPEDKAELARLFKEGAI
jgi:hypothetical protein